VSNAATAPPAATGLAQAGCVVLAPAAAVLPDFARHWTEDRSLRALLVHNPLQALTAVCLLERAQLARAAWGLQRIDSIALLIVDSAQWTDAPRLIAAIRRYLPTVTIHELRGRTIASASKMAESVVVGPGQNCDDSRHVFSSEKGASLPATAPVESPRTRTAIEPDSPAQRVAASAPPVHREDRAAHPRAAAARWPVDVEQHHADELDPAEPMRITRDEIAMLLDDQHENVAP
jgi:hypothetical protein